MPNNENNQKLLKEHQLEFRRFVKTYFDSFGWTLIDTSNDVWTALDALKQPYLIIPIDAPREAFPSLPEVKKLVSNKIVIVSPEYSQTCPLKGTRNCKVNKHTASGIKFCYLSFLSSPN